MAALLLVSIVKYIMNPYPTLHDLNQVFFFFLMNVTLVTNFVESLYFLMAGIFYAISNTLFLWITWMTKFSGNANFYYFQTVVLNAFIVLLFI